MPLNLRTHKHTKSIKRVCNRFRRNDAAVQSINHDEIFNLDGQKTTQEKNIVSRKKSSLKYSQSNKFHSHTTNVAHENREMANSTLSPEIKHTLPLETRENSKPIYFGSNASLHPQDTENIMFSNVDTICRKQVNLSHMDDHFWTEERTEMLTLKRSNPIYESDSDTDDFELCECSSKRSRQQLDIGNAITSISWSDKVPDCDNRYNLYVQ